MSVSTRNECYFRSRLTISSSFSVNAIVNPPSRGTMIPATNAPIHEYLKISTGTAKPHNDKVRSPKIACTPMMSVKNADANSNKIVTVMKNIVGPFSVEPVFLASHRSAILTGKSNTKVHAKHVNNMYRAVNPEPALTSATLSANNVQPMISFPTPAERTTIPTVVSSSFSSVKIRHRTGNAVIEYATPVKSMK